MSRLCVSVVFEEEPEGETRQLVVSEIRSLLALFAPNREIEFKCGKGSWWVHALVDVAQVVVAWVALETLSWTMGKVLDKYCDEQEPESVGSKAVIVQDVARPAVPAAVPVRFEIENVDERMRMLRARLQSIIDTTDATAVSLSEWSDETGMGRIIEFSRGPAGTTYSFHQTDSKEEFNIRTNPAFRVK